MKICSRAQQFREDSATLSISGGGAKVVSGIIIMCTVYGLPIE